MDRILKYIADNTYCKFSNGEAAMFVWDGEVVIIRLTPKLETKYVIISANAKRIGAQVATYLNDLLKSGAAASDIN